jgi:uroporphyrinogen decarboxylase
LFARRKPRKKSAPRDNFCFPPFERADNAPPLTSVSPNRKTRFLAACAGQPVDKVPVWLFRQAGRYLPEYQAVRRRVGDFLTLCTTPELAVEVTLQPVRRFGVDAAILFSDILLPLRAMGLPLTFTDEGPRLTPLSDAAAIEKLRVLSPAALPEVLETVKLLRRELAELVPLIGFAGAPFTLLTYAVEGQTGKNFVRSKRLLYCEPTLAHRLLEKLTLSLIAHLTGQIQAGAQAIQLFDSWIGILSAEDYAVFGAPYVEQILLALRPFGVPLLYFPLGGLSLFPQIGKLSADVISVDWRQPLSMAASLLNSQQGLQGNLEPLLLLGPVSQIEQRLQTVLAHAPRRRYIFNLGHGILPETPPAHVEALVESVHRFGAEPHAPQP